VYNAVAGEFLSPRFSFLPLDLIYLFSRHLV
jgi:hypothetical protein